MAGKAEDAVSMLRADDGGNSVMKTLRYRLSGKHVTRNKYIHSGGKVMGIKPLSLTKLTLGGFAVLAMGLTGFNAIASEDMGLDGRQVEEFRSWRDDQGGGRCLRVDSSWNGEPLARVLFCSKDSENSAGLTSLVYDIMTTRDPAGWLNPYWITDRVSRASYGYTGETEGSVVGRYYDSSYAAWGSFVSMLRSEFSRRDDIQWWGVTQGTCFDDATYREFEYNCTHVSEIAEAKDEVYRATQEKEVKKPAKKKKAKKKAEKKY